MRKLVGWIIAAAVAASGCLAGDGPAVEENTTPTEEPVSSEFVEPEPGVFVAVNRGSVRGTVTNEEEIAIKGARASLVGTNFYADTNETGSFLFENVSLGPQQLSVVAPGFQAYLADLNVEAGKVTDAVVVLLVAEDLDAALRPHLHDYWGDRGEVILMDADVDLTTREANGQSGLTSDPNYAKTVKPNRNMTNPTDNYRFGIKAASDSDPPIIFPGAKELRVTFTWTQENVRLDDMGLIYRHPNSTAFIWREPKTSGQTWTIPVTPDAADDGHEHITSWQFFATSANDAQGNTANWKPAVILGPLHVKMVIVKGDLFLEPAHPTFWKDGDTMVLRNRTNEVNFRVTDRTNGNGGMSADKGMLVAPGTAKMRVAFWYYYKDQANGTIGSDWVLTWRLPSQPMATTPLSEYKRADAFYSRAGLKVYEFPVAPEDWDAFYRKSSGWGWMASPDGQEDDNQLSNSVDYYRGSLWYAIQVTIYKDPEWT
ncbi:MAG: carboxypeptidase regulatory-like domain-containing protein [Euryarchaeota archaeon]|nr:carboxypeptidase regulatory-like domain-containing protein [Euryarchaeota archaeon]